MVGGYCTRRYERRTAYVIGAKRKANRNKKVYCIRSDVLRSVFLGILLVSVGTDTRDWRSVATVGVGSVECVGSAEEKHENFVVIGSVSDMGASWKSGRKSRRCSERKKSNGRVGSVVYSETRGRVCECEVYDFG